MLGKILLPDLLELDGIGRSGSRFSNGVRGQLEELFGWKGVVWNVQVTELLDDGVKVLTRCEAG